MSQAVREKCKKLRFFTKLIIGDKTMRAVLRNLNEKQLLAKRDEMRSIREKTADKLVHEMAQRPYFGKGIEEAYNKYPERVRNLAFAVKNVEADLARMSEAQISSTLGTSPQNVLRVLRLGYLNTCRQDAFWEIGLATAMDVFFYLEPKYKKAIRGATAGDITYQSKSWRSASDEQEWEATETVDGNTAAFSFTADTSDVPITPYTVKLYHNGEVVGSDNGKGIIEGTDTDGTVIKGKITYDPDTSGNTIALAEVTFTTKPAANDTVTLSGAIALEKDTNLDVTQSLELSLRAAPFTLREYPITASFSKKLELTLGTSYGVEAEEAYLRVMADELRKTLDIQAFSLASRQAHANSRKDTVTFSMAGAVGEAETDRIQAISRYIDRAGTKIYDKLMRGGVNVIFGGPAATGILTGHQHWSDTGAQPANGLYRLGNLGDIPVFRVPKEVCADDDLVCVYKNKQLPEDVFLAIGTLLPMHVTDKIEFPGRNTEFGVASYGDMQIINKAYAEVLHISDIDGVTRT